MSRPTYRVVHVDIPVDDSGRAGAFYDDVFGWDVEQGDVVPHWPLGPDDVSGAEGGMAPRSEAPEGPVVYVGVDDIDAALSRVKDAGGTVDIDKVPIPAVGWKARFRDTEGNLVGLFEADRRAPMTRG